MTTPNLALETVPANTLEPSAPVNAALQVLDALVRPGGIVQSRAITAPPTTTGGDVGKRWIIPSGATGAWAGKTGQIALCVGAGLWRYFAPTSGWRAYDIAAATDVVFEGGAWAPAAAASVADGSITGAKLAAGVRKQSIIVACSDEVTALTAGTGKVTFRMPYAFILSAVRASLGTPQTSGSILTVDINEGGTSILSTKLTIDNGEKTSVTAAASPVLSDTALADDAEITIDIDQLGDGTAKGLKVMLIGEPV